jgi:hypothetical protein
LRRNAASAIKSKESVKDLLIACAGTRSAVQPMTDLSSWGRHGHRRVQTTAGGTNDERIGVWLRATRVSLAV